MSRDLCLVLSGGALKGFGILGAIKYIEEKYNMERLKCIVGTSIGSIIGYLLCIGYNPMEILHKTIENKLIEKICDGIDLNLIGSTQGLLQFDTILEELEIMTLMKHNQTFTMSELFKTFGVELVCVTFNYSKNQMEILSKQHTPDLPCLRAIQMSSSVPFLFNKMIYNDMIYIDGGVVDNFPIRIAIKYGMKHIIGITANKDNINSFQNLSVPIILALPIVQNTRKTIKKFKKKYPIIDIELSPIMFDFSIKVPGIMEMFSKGYQTCKNFFEN